MPLYFARWYNAEKEGGAIMSTEAWKAENTVRYHFRLSKNTGIPGALQKMTEKTGESDLAYIRRVVTDALIRDGFLQKNTPGKK